ncbi:hypothetical protein DFQ27_002792 [Actinomortierella ambigua]|uniref:Galactose oxidase n=1 Tax=Actinomortierella ambigua TaxID=1343610 RepID=A0A9P6QAI3_9FUNG|nr:hypothetical protein DFQ27_002792 [Actinomortierella ambigua]
MPFPPHRRKWCSIGRVLATAACCITVLQVSLAAPTGAAGTPQPRSLHTGTYLGDSIHFVGGLTAREGIANQTLSLRLDSLVFTFEKTDIRVYNHVAIAENKTEASTVGVVFGDVQGEEMAPPLQWVQLNGSPTKVPSTNKSAVIPDDRRSHSLAQISNKYYILGGENAFGKPVLDIPVYDTISAEWTIIKPKTPLQRIGHSSVAIDSNNILICFGQDKTPLPAASVPTTTKSSATSTRSSTATPTATSTAPAAPSSTLPSTATSDCLIYEISTDTLRPIQLLITDQSISFAAGLVGHTMVRNAENQQYLFMFGGSNLSQNATYSDTLIFDVSDINNIVVRRPPRHQDPTKQDENKPSARAFHSATVVGGKGNLLVVYGGADPSHTINDTQPYFFSMKDLTWIDSNAFVNAYEQSRVRNYTNVWIIITPIMGSVTLLGVAVFVFIRRGLAKTEEERRRKEYENRLSTMSGGRFSPTGAGRRGAGEGGGAMTDNMENKRRQVYPSTSSSDDHSMSHGAFKSTTSLIQPPPEALAKSNSHQRRQQNNHHRADSNASTVSTISTPRSRSNSRGEHALSGGQASVLTPATSGAGSSNATTLYGSSGGGGNGAAPYYNPLDLYPDDSRGQNHHHQRRHGSDNQQDDDFDDDTSVGNSDSTMSPWAGTLQLANPRDNFEFAPPNPRFSRGALSAAHRQLISNANGHRASVTSYNNVWESQSPGGASVSSRDDESHRRSVNSMHARAATVAAATAVSAGGGGGGGAGGGLTVRNASWIQQADTPRGSVYGSYYNNTPGGGAPSSDGGGTTASDDSFAPGTFGGYHSPASSQSGSITGGERRISAAVMARQQRRSQLRSSQDSFGPAPGGTPTVTADAATPPFVTKAIPILNTRPTKPTGLQMQPMPTAISGAGSSNSGDTLQVTRRDGTRGGAGAANTENRLSFGLPTIDDQSLSTTMGMTTSGNINLNAALLNMGMQPNGGMESHPTTTCTPIATTTSAHEPRISSMLNPKRTSRTPSANYGQPQPPPPAHTSSSNSRPGATTNVILKMPPPPKHPLPRSMSSVQEVD